MRTPQHKLARQVLRLIEANGSSSGALTYSGVAKALQRPENHARAVAQACDLLDAAACFAGIPLLALAKVLTKAGTINPKAWQEDTALRDAILRRSSSYSFTIKDYGRITEALDAFRDRGNRDAWKYLYVLYTKEELRSRLLYTSFDGTDAVDENGSDLPDRAKSQSWHYERNQQVRAAVLKRANGCCEYCGPLAFSRRMVSDTLSAITLSRLRTKGETV